MAVEDMSSLKPGGSRESFGSYWHEKGESSFEVWNRGLYSIQRTKTPIKIARQLLTWLKLASLDEGHREVISAQKSIVKLIGRTYSIPKFVRSEIQLYQKANSLYQKIINKCRLKEIAKGISSMANGVLVSLRSTLSLVCCLDSTRVIDLGKISPALPKAVGELSCVVGLVSGTKRMVDDVTVLVKNLRAKKPQNEEQAKRMKAKNVKVLLSITLNLVKITSFVVLALGLFWSVYLSPAIILVCSSVAFSITMGQDVERWLRAKPSYIRMLRARIALLPA